MPQLQINLSDDIKRLKTEGYAVQIKPGFLVVRDIPYVTSSRKVFRGVLVAHLDTAGDVVAPSGDHTVYFSGEMPCDKDGNPFNHTVIDSEVRHLAADLTTQFRFSRKPPEGYKDYYHKITTYISLLLAHAQAIDPDVTPRTHGVIETDEDESVFNYWDTASTRAGITMVSRKLSQGKVGIIGVGGTGSYVLDLVAKTPVEEIHLFDGDTFYSHNAFRAPSAASVDELRAQPNKVDYFATLYSKMRRGITPHPYYIDASNIGDLAQMDFVFLCIDAGDSKTSIVEGLETLGVSFVDTGMGLELVDDSLRGAIRVTTSTKETREHFREHVSLAEAGINEEYDTNIQVADLNALNATLAVIKWKKLCGFYLDFKNEYHSMYIINSNMLDRDEPA